MAKIVGAFFMSHSSFCYANPDSWNAARATRVLRSDVPMDDQESNRRKFERIQSSTETLKQKLAEARPDVIVIIGDDQMECFDFRNLPAFAVYVGESFEGEVITVPTPKTGAKQPGTRTRIKGHPPLAVALLTGLMKRGFDPAFCMDMPNAEEGIGHAFMRPAQSLTNLETPIVPILFNAFYAPQPTAERCYALGKAVRATIDEYPEDLRVAIVGSGGLWHTPGKPGAYLDEAFDETILGYMKKGDIKAIATHFDEYRIPPGDKSQDISERTKVLTGMPGLSGPQGGGTRETCGWIAAAATLEGNKATIVDRVPIYASPIDTCYAYIEA